MEPQEPADCKTVVECWRDLELDERAAHIEAIDRINADLAAIASGATVH